MTDPSAVIVGLLTNLSFGVPLLLLCAVVIIWILTNFDHFPPLFRPIGPDRSWVKGPLAWAEEGIAADRISPVVSYSLHRVQEVLRKRYGIPRTGPGPLWPLYPRYPEEATVLLRMRRTLSEAYYLAWLAEAEVRRDFWSRWRRPTWKRRSRELFAGILPALERLVPPLEVGA